MLVYGAQVTGKKQPLNTIGEASLTSPGEVYEFELDVEGIPDETQAITQLLQLESEVADLRVLYVETDPLTRKIRLQFTDAGPGQFSLAAALSLIPTILVVAGIILVGIIAWQIFTGPNPWVLPLLVVIGGGVTFYLLFGTQLFGQAPAAAPTRAVGTKTKQEIEHEKWSTEKEIAYSSLKEKRLQLQKLVDIKSEECKRKTERYNNLEKKYFGAKTAQKKAELKEALNEAKIERDECESKKNAVEAELARI